MEGQGSQASPPPSARLPGRYLRQATLILPTTGERVKRDFTLRDPALYQSANGNAANPLNNEQTPLLPVQNQRPSTSRFQALLQKIRVLLKDAAQQAFDFSQSDTGHGVLKCTLAYFVATLATFANPVAGVLGTHQDGNQLVANVVVWFDPARSAGSMELAVLFALLAFVYGAVLSFTSMGISGFFASHGLLVVGYVIVVVFFCGGGLGLLAWVKQYYNHQLLNVATSVASLAIVTVLTREGAVQLGDFSAYKIMQVLKMLFMGIIISTLINLILWPISARSKLRESLEKSTQAFGELLALITGSFLSGLEEDINHPVVVQASDRFKSVFSSLPTHLAEARYEHYLLGAEERYYIEKRLVKCMQQLAQDIGGLRSAAAIQFSLLSESRSASGSNDLHVGHKLDSKTSSRRRALTAENVDRAMHMLESTGEGQDFSNQAESNGHPQGADKNQPRPGVNIQSARSPAQIFETFITELGPPMKSLAYTLREILKNLPYIPGEQQPVNTHAVFRTSLADAIKLFATSRREALSLVYKSKELSEAHEVPIAADFEEVAASCGHFSSSLQDFAENCLKYIDILDELDTERIVRRVGRSWKWLLFWRRDRLNDEEEKDADDIDVGGQDNALTRTISKPSDLAQPPASNFEKPAMPLPFPYRLYPYLRFTRREDIRFAVKVGGGAAFYAMFAYIPETRPFYIHWHLEWGLAAYMLVCSMTVGASNTTGISRFYGTLIGGACALMVWVVSRENPCALALLGALVSLVCFYYIQARGQAPMGRFILLTYNLSVLYAYALSIEDPDADPNEGHGENPTIVDIVINRVVAILIGGLSGIIVTRMIWPIKARKKLKYGLSLLWLRMGLIWKRAPFSILLEENKTVLSYMDIREESKLRQFVDTLDTIRKNAESEFKLRGPFPTESFDALLQSTTRMLDGFHALHVVITKDLKASPGETEILRYTADEGNQLARRISHLLSVLASSVNMEYPLTDTFPDISHTRDRLLAKVFEFRKSANKTTEPTDEDYELLYAYALVTAQIAKEIEISGKEIEKLYGTLSEDVLKLQ